MDLLELLERLPLHLMACALSQEPTHLGRRTQLASLPCACCIRGI